MSPAPAVVAAPTAAEWTPRASISISGIPRPGGSKTATLIRRKGGAIVMCNGRPLITTREAGTHTKEWRALVAYTARQQYQGEPIRGPIRLSAIFFMPRPKGHFRTGKRAGELKPDAPQWHTCKPDRTKLMRSTEDALTGILWADDTLIVAGPVEKRYGCAGVELLIEEWALAAGEGK